MDHGPGRVEAIVSRAAYRNLAIGKRRPPGGTAIAEARRLKADFVPILLN